jgi:hypothetical protein
VAQAEAQAAQLLTAAKAEAERQRTAAQRYVDDLNEQKKGVTEDLAQVSQVLGAQMPRLAAALKRSPAKRASRSGQQIGAPLAPLRAGAPAGPEFVHKDASADKDAGAE